MSTTFDGKLIQIEIAVKVLNMSFAWSKAASVGRRRLFCFNYNDGRNRFSPIFKRDRLLDSALGRPVLFCSRSSPAIPTASFSSRMWIVVFWTGPALRRWKGLFS